MPGNVHLGLGWIVCLAVSPSYGFAAGQHVDMPAAAATAPPAELPAAPPPSVAPDDPVHRMLLQKLAPRPLPTSSSTLVTRLLESSGSDWDAPTLPDLPSPPNGQSMDTEALAQQRLLQPALRHATTTENPILADNALIHLQTPPPPGHWAALQASLRRRLAPDCVKPADHHRAPYVALAKNTGLTGSTEVAAYKTWALMNQPNASDTVKTQLQRWGVTDAYVERGATQFDAFREAPVARNAVVGIAGFAAFYNIAAWMDAGSPADACADQEGWAFLRHGEPFRLWMGILGLVLAIAVYSLLKKAGVFR